MAASNNLPNPRQPLRPTPFPEANVPSLQRRWPHFFPFYLPRHHPRIGTVFAYGESTFQATQQLCHTAFRFTFHSTTLFFNILWGLVLIAGVYAAYRYRANGIAKKAAVEAARKSKITGHIDDINSNREKNEKQRKATAQAETERRAAAAAAAAAAAEAQVQAKMEISKSKERVKKMRVDVWKQLSTEFKVGYFRCALSYHTIFHHNAYFAISGKCKRIRSVGGCAGAHTDLQRC
jgi:hypothetical protein